MVHCAQIIIHLSLFTLLFPKLLSVLYEYLVSISQLKIFNLESKVDRWLQLGEGKAFSYSFSQTGYQSSLMMQNIGEMVLYLLMLVIALPLLSFLLRSGKTSCPRVQEYLRRQVKPFFVRFVLEVYLELVICSGVNVLSIPKGWGEVCSFGLSIVLLCGCEWLLCSGMWQRS